MDVLNFISENTYIVAVVLWVLGEAIKAIPRIPNWVIPFVLMAAGTGLCIGLLGLDVQAVMQGILCAGGAVLADQAVKQVRSARVRPQTGAINQSGCQNQ